MLSRRHLRIKALQALYAFRQSHNDRLDVGEKQLLESINNIYDLYIHQLSFLLEVVDFAESRIDDGKQKHLPTAEDLNPNMRFVNNRLLSAIRQNRDFKRTSENLKINWQGEEELIRKVYIELKESKEYQAYMQSDEDTFARDKKIIGNLFKNYLSGNELLCFHYEELNIHWGDDIDIANMMVLKTVKVWEEAWDQYHDLPSLYRMPEHSSINEDRIFVRELFRKTVMRDKTYEEIISKKTQNWEMDRIAIVDMLLLKMALAELLEMPEIPVKVTLNEYIDLSKMFSTPKSRVFINGVLDKLIVELKEEEKIKKHGRGLME